MKGVAGHMFSLLSIRRLWDLRVLRRSASGNHSGMTSCTPSKLLRVTAPRRSKDLKIMSINPVSQALIALEHS